MAVSQQIITSQIDFTAFLWPADTVDLDSEPGTVLLLPGVVEARAAGPGWQHPDWTQNGDWMPHEGDLTMADGLRFLMRWKCAANQAGLAAAEWSLWRSIIFPVTVAEHPEITHRYRFDPMEAILNEENGMVEAGPWWNAEVWLKR